MPFNIQPIHLVAIAIAALLIFGPKRLPEIGRGLGKALTEFRNGAKEMTEGFRQEVMKTESEAEPAKNNPADANFCNQCGAPNPASARFCNHCGSEIKLS